MLSLFLHSRGHATKDPASGPPMPGEEADLHPETERTPEANDAASETEVDFAAGDLAGLVSVIVANAEFLEVLYGENRYLKNILAAAGKAQRLHNAHACQE